MAARSLSLSKRLIAVGLLFAVGLGLGAVLLEVGVRFFFPVSDFFWEFDPAIGMKLIRGKEGRAIQRGIFDTRIKVNSVGFSDREHTPQKPAGTRRVVMLGDTFLEPVRVQFERVISWLLQKRLL